MNRSSLFLFAPLLAISGSFGLAACGGTTAGGSEPDSDAGAQVPALPAVPTATPPANPTTEPSGPPLPMAPYSPRVDTTDVSILYPLPAAGAAGSFLRASEGGSLGPLLPRAAFEKVLGRRSLDFEMAAGYDDLALVGLRLDPCSSRNTQGRGCTPEIRAVFQGISKKADGTTVAADGGVHVAYDISDRELGEALLEILAAKYANGDTGAQELGPHPILVAQGLEGSFATRLRAIVLRHLGEARIGRVTAFDHNMDPDSDGWTFGVIDRVKGAYVEGTIPGVSSRGQTVFGSSAHVELADSSAGTFNGPSSVDPVADLVAGDRPAPGSPGASALGAVFEAAIRLENPKLHSAESTDCANCHLAEGAHRIGASIYGLTTTKAFANGRSTARRDERTSVTNLHAFGYLGRQVSISQRTANESALVAEQLAGRVVAR